MTEPIDEYYAQLDQDLRAQNARLPEQTIVWANLLGDEPKEGPALLVGPYCIIEHGAKIGRGYSIGPYTHIMNGTTVGEFCVLIGCTLEGCHIGDRTKVYRGTHIMQAAMIGDDCLIGDHCFIADGAKIGNNVRMMRNVGIGRVTTIEDDVFLACNITFSNNRLGGVQREVVVEKGAWIGNNVVSSDSVGRIGHHSIIGAGSVVTKDVPPFAVMVGNPAKLLRWNTVDGKEPR